MTKYEVFEAFLSNISRHKKTGNRAFLFVAETLVKQFKEAEGTMDNGAVNIFCDMYDACRYAREGELDKCMKTVSTAMLRNSSIFCKRSNN